MFTVTFVSEKKIPLYEQLYRRIREGIESGEMKRNEKLPSKRKLAKHLQISTFTVQSAYSQLLAEGYITSQEKKGYFVCPEPVIVQDKGTVPLSCAFRKTEEPSPCLALYDLKTNAVDTENFPYSVWSRLMRESMFEDRGVLLHAMHPQGNYDLRCEIAHYLRSFRDVNIRPEQIILGAGIEYIIGLIAELLPSAIYAYENPGYPKIRKILESRRMSALPVLADEGGLSVNHLAQTNATAVFVTPSNHFPTGAVMGIGRRRQLIEWAQRKENYVIEDDFNSEFRFMLKPIPALQSFGEKVVYINSFTQTLAPSLRIAYAVLPEPLLHQYKKRLMFYSCTVSQFEQLTLKRFLQDGYYERHLGRMKTVYKTRQNTFIDSLSPLKENFAFYGREAGLHLRIQSAALPEEKLLRLAMQRGVRVYPFSDYYATAPAETHTVVVGYGGYSSDELRHAAELLCAAWYV